MFGCVPALFGDCFLLASDQERQAYMRERAAVHGQHFQDGDEVPLSSCFSPKENLEILDTTLEWQSKASVSGVCIRDLEQSLKFMDACPFVPTLLKHGKIISVAGDPNDTKLFVPRELMAAMGEPCIFPCNANGFDSYAWTALGQCNLRKKRRGQNGWERDAPRGVGPRDHVLLLERSSEAGRVIALRVALAKSGERR